jgi:predicted transcriptional regulator
VSRPKPAGTAQRCLDAAEHRVNARLAQERGTDPQSLVREAIERLLDYDDWFAREVEKGLAQIESGQTLTHDEVSARLRRYLT